MIYARMEINLRVLSTGERMDMQYTQNTEMISFDCHHDAQAMDSRIRIRAQATYCTLLRETHIPNSKPIAEGSEASRTSTDH